MPTPQRRSHSNPQNRDYVTLQCKTNFVDVTVKDSEMVRLSWVNFVEPNIITRILLKQSRQRGEKEKEMVLGDWRMLLLTLKMEDGDMS